MEALKGCSTLLQSRNKWNVSSCTPSLNTKLQTNINGKQTNNYNNNSKLAALNK